MDIIDETTARPAPAEERPPTTENRAQRLARFLYQTFAPRSVSDWITIALLATLAVVIRVQLPVPADWTGTAAYSGRFAEACAVAVLGMLTLAGVARAAAYGLRRARA